MMFTEGHWQRLYIPGKILDQEMENRYASKFKIFIMSRSSCKRVTTIKILNGIGQLVNGTVMIYQPMLNIMMILLL